MFTVSDPPNGYDVDRPGSYQVNTCASCGYRGYSVSEHSEYSPALKAAAPPPGG